MEDTSDPVSDLTDEMEAVNNMLKRAEEYGLQAEVVRMYGQYRARGKSVEKAASHALAEFDLL